MLDSALEQEGLTRYQRLIVRYLEAKYHLDAAAVIRHLHKKARYSDISKLVGCSENTLLSLCKKLGIKEPPTVVSYTPTYRNATDFFKQFDSVEDAITECRDPDRLALSVKDTVRKLGIGRSTIVRHTPEYLKYTFNFSKDRKGKSVPSADHSWRQ